MPIRNVSLTDFHDRDAEDAGKLARFEMLIAEGEASYARGEFQEVPADGIGEWVASLGRTGRSPPR